MCRNAAAGRRSGGQARGPAGFPNSAGEPGPAESRQTRDSDVCGPAHQQGLSGSSPGCPAPGRRAAASRAQLRLRRTRSWAAAGGPGGPGQKRPGIIRPTCRRPAGAPDGSRRARLVTAHRGPGSAGRGRTVAAAGRAALASGRAGRPGPGTARAYGEIGERGKRGAGGCREMGRKGEKERGILREMREMRERPKWE